MRTPTTRAQQKSWARDSAGCIVTVREQDTGELRTTHHPGLLREALEDACHAIDSLEGEWRIVTISTPRTIHGDLQLKPRRDELGRDRQTTEALVLGKVGRLDLLERKHQVIRDNVSTGRASRAQRPAA